MDGQLIAMVFQLVQSKIVKGNEKYYVYALKIFNWNTKKAERISSFRLFI